MSTRFIHLWVTLMILIDNTFVNGMNCNPSCTADGSSVYNCIGLTACSVDCSASNSCQYATINSDSAASLTVTTDETADPGRNLYYATINCPTAGTCSVTCTGATESCQALTIEARLASSLNVYCTDSESDDTCGDMYIRCPDSFGSTCSLQYSGTSNSYWEFDSSDIYSVHGFKQVSITGTSSVQTTYATLHCRDNDASSCTIDGTTNKCNNAPQTCDNPPTNNPTVSPTTTNPTTNPTTDPTLAPTQPPSIAPTQPPSNAPSDAPTQPPSIAPTQPPSSAPSDAPTQPPSIAPTQPPSIAPTQPPSSAPTNPPSNAPSKSPTVATNPSTSPTKYPTTQPSAFPTKYPSAFPTKYPSTFPTNPSAFPTKYPSTFPTKYPSSQPSKYPTEPPTNNPITPTNNPTEPPTNKYPTKPPTVDGAQNSGDGAGGNDYTVLIFIVVLILVIIFLVVILIIYRNKQNKLNELNKVASVEGMEKETTIQMSETQTGHDPATDLPMKSIMNEQLVDLCNKNEINAAVCSADMDGMKQLNDTLGHHITDNIIKSIADILAKESSENENVSTFRMNAGGDEFAMIVRDTSEKAVIRWANDLRKEIDYSTKASISIGVAIRGDKETKKQWFNRAENALRKAKKQGKNIVVLADLGNTTLILDTSAKENVDS